jgi:putative transcriptional regulator
MVRASGPVRPDSSGYGLLIRSRRNEVGLTQQSMAEAVNVSRQTVIAMETGDYAPSVFLALKVARVLDTSVEALGGSST